MLSSITPNFLNFLSDQKLTSSFEKYCTSVSKDRYVLPKENNNNIVTSTLSVSPTWYSSETQTTYKIKGNALDPIEAKQAEPFEHVKIIICKEHLISHHSNQECFNHSEFKV